MTTTNPTTDTDREALEIELEEISDDLDGASIIGVILTICDYLEIDPVATLKSDERTSEHALLDDLISTSQSTPTDLIMPKIIRALEIDAIMLSFED